MASTEESGRPARVAPGQRYKDLGGEYTVMTVADGCFSFRRDTGHRKGELFSPVPMHQMGGDTYLGHTDITPAAAPKAVEADENGDPVACLTCGSVALHCVHFCGSCSPGSVPYTVAQREMIEAWKDGARDFPRPSVNGDKAKIQYEDRDRERGKTYTVSAAYMLAESVVIGSELASDPPKSAQAINEAVLADIAPSPVAAPTRRQVSHNGRDWTDYDKLTDSDAWEDYGHRRLVAGNVITKRWYPPDPVAAFRVHVENEQDIAEDMKAKNDEYRARHSERNEVTRPKAQSFSGTGGSVGVGIWVTRPSR